MAASSCIYRPRASGIPASSSSSSSSFRSQLPEDFAASSGAITRNDAHSFHALRGLQPTAYRPDVSYPGTRFATTFYSAPMSISSPAWQSWVRAYWSLRERPCTLSCVRIDRLPRCPGSALPVCYMTGARLGHWRYVLDRNLLHLLDGTSLSFVGEPGGALS